MILSRTFASIAIIAAAMTTVTACAATPAPAPATSTEQVKPAADVITMSDAWVKTADKGMTAAFGTLTNAGDADVTVVGATTAAATMSELHETVEDASGAMVMRPIEGGFVLPARSDFVLKPAGNHIMLMELTAPLHAGDEVPFTLEFADGSTLAFTAVVKDYSGANENYVGSGDE